MSETSAETLVTSLGRHVGLRAGYVWQLKLYSLSKVLLTSPKRCTSSKTLRTSAKTLCTLVRHGIRLLRGYLCILIRRVLLLGHYVSKPR